MTRAISGALATTRGGWSCQTIGPMISGDSTEPGSAGSYRIPISLRVHWLIADQEHSIQPGHMKSKGPPGVWSSALLDAEV